MKAFAIEVTMPVAERTCRSTRPQSSGRKQVAATPAMARAAQPLPVARRPAGWPVARARRMHRGRSPRMPGSPRCRWPGPRHDRLRWL